MEKNYAQTGQLPTIWSIPTTRIRSLRPTRLSGVPHQVVKLLRISSFSVFDSTDYKCFRQFVSNENYTNQIFGEQYEKVFC